MDEMSNAEKITSRFWVLNRKSNGSFQVSFLFKSLKKNREVIFCVIPRLKITCFWNHLPLDFVLFKIALKNAFHA